MSAKERKEKWTRKIKETNKRVFLKFAIGDYGWYIHKDMLRRSKIDVVIQTLGCTVKYITVGLSFTEDEIFQTKQALINSLYIEFEQQEGDKK